LPGLCGFLAILKNCPPSTVIVGILDCLFGSPQKKILSKKMVHAEQEKIHTKNRRKFLTDTNPVGNMFFVMEKLLDE